MRKIAVVVAGLVLLGWFGIQSSQDPAETAGDRPAAPRSGQTASPNAHPEPATGRRDKGQADRPSDTRVRHHDRAGQRESTPRPVHQPVKRHPVLDVVDGDTVKVAYRGSETSVRVIGIDTPETVHPSEPVECGGPQASAAATRMLAGKDVRLVFDASQGRTDTYGRTLAYLHAPGVGDFGRAMIRRGLAAEYTYDTAYARRGRYVAAENGAQARDRGVWDDCGGVDTPLGGEPQSAPTPSARPDGGGGGCAPGYDPCVPPYPQDLDCSDVEGPVRVTGDDPHGFDGDGDGIGCDS